jgi:hypothetical protein
MSETSTRLPGFTRARRSSPKTAALSGTRLIARLPVSALTRFLALLDRQLLEPALAEVDVRRADLRRRGTRALQHLGRHVHSDHAPRAPHLFGREESVEARPRAEVHHGLALLELEVAERHAAAQAQVGFLRHAREVARRIAELLRWGAAVSRVRGSCAP